MAQFKVDDFLIELKLDSQKILKGLEKAEKQTMQVASRIEKRLNKAFKVNPTPLNDSLKLMEKNVDKTVSKIEQRLKMNRPGFPGECFICELRLPDHRFRWKHNKLFLLLPEEYGPAFPAIVEPPRESWRLNFLRKR